MTQDEIIKMAKNAGAAAGRPTPNAPEIVFTQCLDIYQFAKLVAQHAKAEEREACAEVAMTLTRRMKETEKAHYNHSAEPFIAERFGFERGLILEGQKIADAIRARGDSK